MKRASLPLAIVTALMIATPTFSQEKDPTELAPQTEDRSDRDHVVQFLKKVIGRRLVHHSVSKLDNGKIEADFTRKWVYCNLAETEKGFVFDAVTHIKQTNYDLDENGKRNGPGTKKDRAVVERYEVGERESTGKLLGYRRVVSNTLQDATGTADLVRVDTEPGKITLRISTVGYTDLFAAEDKSKPGVAEGTAELSESNGLLHYEETYRVFEIDPDSLERTPVSSPLSLEAVEER